MFHGGVDLDLLQKMMQWQEQDVNLLAGQLVETGLATADTCNHLTLNPALCPYAWRRCVMPLRPPEKPGIMRVFRRTGPESSSSLMTHANQRLHR